MAIRTFVILLTVFLLSACSKCDSNQATNKMLALGKVQARMMARGGEGLANFAASFAVETGSVSELIAQGKYGEACELADKIAAKYEMDLDKEQKDMVTIEQLTKDGGKGTGTCSLADAAKRQMEVHGWLQAEVDAGRMTSDIFSTFGEDSRSFGELLSTNPSKACELMDNLKAKYAAR